jgi:hypothetical protein
VERRVGHREVWAEVQRAACRQILLSCSSTNPPAPCTSRKTRHRCPHTAHRAQPSL